MIYFVSGATGFLGGRVVELLLQRGDQVIAFGRNPHALKRLEALGARAVQGDLTDVDILIKSIPEGGSVIHCGALSTPWAKKEDYLQANVNGTEILCSVSLKKRVNRFVHISTPSIYVERFAKENILESDPLPSVMINDYANTKLLAEKVVENYVQQGLSALILRPQGIFGPRDTAIIPRLIRVAQKGFVPVMNEGVKIDLTYVDNVVHAIFCALRAQDQYVGEKYNITNGEPVDQLLTLEYLLEKLGYRVKRKWIPNSRAWFLAGILEWVYRTFALQGEPILTRYSVCTLAFTRTLSIEKARRELGYDPQVSMIEGLERTIPWFAQLHS